MNRRFRFIAKRLIQVKYISLVNLLLDRGLFPEYPTAKDESPGIAADVLKWLEHPDQREAVVDELRQLRDRVAKPGAVERAADFLMNELVGSLVSLSR
jgi:lipid-A-disaccharide synthase